MNSEELILKVGIYPASFILSFVSGLVPFVNAELLLLAISSTTAGASLAPIALFCAFGQMLAKAILFYAGRGVFKIRPGKSRNAIEAVRQKFAQRQNKPVLLILINATVGFPPFYVVSFVAGSINMNFLTFFAAGLVGRTIRFVAIAFFPQLIVRLL